MAEKFEFQATALYGRHTLKRAHVDLTPSEARVAAKQSGATTQIKLGLNPRVGFL